MKIIHQMIKEYWERDCKDIERDLENVENAIDQAQEDIEMCILEIERLSTWQGAYSREAKFSMKLSEENRRLRKALESIIGWGTLCGSYTDISAASTFQKIAKEALEG